MKTIVSLFAMCLAGTMAWTQAPYFNLSTSTVIIPEPQRTNIEDAVGDVPYCIRLYAQIPEDWEIQTLYGLNLNNWSLSTTGAFYQHPIGDPTTKDLNPLVFPTFPELEYDSWFTIGYEANAGSNLLVIPIDQAFFDNWENGGNLLVNDIFGASLAVTALPTTFPPNTADANGQVLLGQFTATGDISGCLNVQLRKLNPDGTVFLPITTVQFTNVCFTYEIPTPSCPGDTDNNGVVSVTDLLAFMGYYGCAEGCLYDYTEDGQVNTSDLLTFLSYFGIICY